MTDNAEQYSEYSFLLEKTQRTIKRFAMQKFAEFGFDVTVDQWMVLKQLHYHQSLSQTELAKATFKGMPTLTRIVDILSDKGLVVREADPTDRRKFQAKLTARGGRIVKTMLPKVASIRKAAWDGLSKEDFDNFQRVLNTIQQNLKL